jgi:hypothetical protein
MKRAALRPRRFRLGRRLDRSNILPYWCDFEATWKIRNKIRMMSEAESARRGDGDPGTSAGSRLVVLLQRASMPESFIIRSLFSRNDLRLFQLAAKPMRNLAP